MVLWAGHSIEERTVLFIRRFPNKMLSCTGLRRLYKQHAIKRKVVRKCKVIPPHKAEKGERERRAILKKLEDGKKKNHKLIWLDEVNFTKLAMPKLEWAARSMNIKVD